MTVARMLLILLWFVAYMRDGIKHKFQLEIREYKDFFSPMQVP